MQQYIYRNTLVLKGKAPEILKQLKEQSLKYKTVKELISVKLNELLD